MAWRLRLGTGDTKRGTLIGIDRFGNKYFENMEEELPRMLKRACVWKEWPLSQGQSVQDGSTTRTPNTSREYNRGHDVGAMLTILEQLSDRAWMVRYKSVYWNWTISDQREGTRGCPTWSTSPPQRTSFSTVVSGLGSPRSTSPSLQPRGAPTSLTARM